MSEKKYETLEEIKGLATYTVEGMLAGGEGVHIPSEYEVWFILPMKALQRGDQEVVAIRRIPEIGDDGYYVVGAPFDLGLLKPVDELHKLEKEHNYTFVHGGPFDTFEEARSFGVMYLLSVVDNG